MRVFSWPCRLGLSAIRVAARRRDALTCKEGGGGRGGGGGGGSEGNGPRLPSGKISLLYFTSFQFSSR